MPEDLQTDPTHGGTWLRGHRRLAGAEHVVPVPWQHPVGEPRPVAGGGAVRKPGAVTVDRFRRCEDGIGLYVMHTNDG